MTPDSSYATLDAALPELLGTSPPMRELLALVRQVAPYASTVLITGGIDPEAHPDVAVQAPAAGERENGAVAGAEGQAPWLKRESRTICLDLGRWAQRRRRPTTRPSATRLSQTPSEGLERSRKARWVHGWRSRQDGNG
jgi:hypothetical protein